MNSKILSLLLIASLVLTLARTPVSPSQAAVADVTFTVTTSFDYNPGAPNGTCYNSVVEGCGLREAIVEANAAAGNKTINFSSSLAGLTFYLNSPNYGLGGLVISGNNITIDGSTSGGTILIDAGGLGPNNNLFEIQGNNNLIRHLMLRGWRPNIRYPGNDFGHGIRIYDPTANGMASYNTLDYLRIFGFEHNGVLISGDSGGGGHDNTISHSLIGGANWGQTTCPGDGNGWDGIMVANGADNTMINASQIVCNDGFGIELFSAGGQIVGTQIQTNKIGTNGSVDMGNHLSGIIDSRAYNTVIYNNQISANDNFGVWLEGSKGAQLTNNRIGLDVTGNLALPNSYDGVLISDQAENNTIGSATYHNWISGNANCGIRIDSGASNNIVDNNYIGLNLAGTAAVPNGAAGVGIFDSNSNDNVIGSAIEGVRQFISGNGREGIYIENAHGTVIGRNTYIGVAGDRVTALGNGLEAVLLNNAIGTNVYPSIVAYNGGAGIAVIGAGAIGNDAGPLEIKYNGGLPIDLGNDGHTPNDAGDIDTGPNGLLNYPVITSASGNPVVLSGTACSNCWIAIYRAIDDPSAPGGGGIFIDAVMANGSGNWRATLPAGIGRNDVTLQTYNDSAYNSSEFSPRRIWRLFLPLILR